jgi:hypothetical protein
MGKNGTQLRPAEAALICAVEGDGAPYSLRSTVFPRIKALLDRGFVEEIDD